MKSKLRSTVAQKRLKALLLATVERDLLLRLNDADLGKNIKQNNNLLNVLQLKIVAKRAFLNLIRNPQTSILQVRVQ